MGKPFFVFEGVQLFIARRRYGGTTYSWVSYRLDNGEWDELGDPWPCITPKRSEVIEAYRQRQQWLAKRAVEVGLGH